MVYFAFAVTVLIGFWLRNKNSVRLIATGVLVSSLSFFVITNFGVWAFGTLYPKTIQGLVACFTAAIPYFRNSLLSNVLFSAILFVGFWLAEKKFPVLKESAQAKVLTSA